MCVAPAFDGWYRAVTLDYYHEEDEVLVRYVDYGGYGRLPRSDLRQIRLASKKYVRWMLTFTKDLFENAMDIGALEIMLV